MRLAYLCNVYPAVSHSFVRREIEGIESAGHSVARFTIRPPASNLRDEADLREADLTETVLGQGLLRLLLVAFGLILSRPAKSFAALLSAYRLSGPGVKAKARHAAYWLEAAWLVRRLESLRIDHLHVHFGTNPTAVAVIVRAWGGPPFSFTAHGPDEFDAPVTLSLAAKIQACSFVAAISSYGRSQLMRWSDPDQWHKIEVIRCGLGHDFTDAPVVPIAESSNQFVCVARLSAQKGLPLLISACRRLRERGEQFTINVIGDGELRPALQAQIDGDGLEDHVHLVGIRSSTEIRGYLNAARAFVLPSFAEGLPVVLMESLAAARPVITTSIAGIPELVQPDCGWVIPAGSEDALVDAMLLAMRASSEDLRHKGQVGRERVRLLHDAGTNSARLIEAIERTRVTCTR